MIDRQHDLLMSCVIKSIEFFVSLYVEELIQYVDCKGIAANLFNIFLNNFVACELK